MSSDLDDAWEQLQAVTPTDWFVGRPSYDDRHNVWEQHAFDRREPARAGARAREWTAVVPTELEVIRELARCIRLIRVDRVPQ